MHLFVTRKQNRPLKQREKLAHQFYGDFKQWWVIAGFNKKPTESHVKMGDTIRIPKDISEALEVIE